MSPPAFQLTITNKSNTTKRMFVCQDVGDPVNGPEEPIQNHIFTSVWVGADMTVHFELCSDGSDYGVMIGYSKDTPAMNYHAEAWKPVQLGGSVVEITSTTDGEDVKFVVDSDQPLATAHTPGGFSIATDNSFPFPSPADMIIGWGKKDGDGGEMHPVQTWKAQPGMMTQVYPAKKYFVAFGDGKEGTVVDKSLLGKVLQVDFTDCVTPVALFTLNSHGAYEADAHVEENGIKWKFDKVQVQKDE